jgi:Fe-S-cluster containining protein
MPECKKCGDCCRQLIFFIPSLPESYIEYYENRGCRIENNKLIVPYECPHLGVDNLCMIYENRPALCREYEGQSGFYKPKGCGYGRS